MFSLELKAAINGAIDAGDVLLSSKGIDLLPTQKESARDVVTRVDEVAEAMVIQSISKALGRNIYFLAEESGDCRDGSSDYWIIDALDGTANYLGGLALYGVSVAYVKDSQLYAAAIFLPESRDLYFAQRGLGAFRNNSRIVYRGLAFEKSLNLITMPGKFESEETEQVIFQASKKINNMSRGVLRLGSAVYGLSLVCTGSVSNMFAFEAYIWDVAAGLLISEESGAYVSRYHLDELKTSVFVGSKDNMVASTVGTLFR